ncbi:MAG: hypothetical protein LBV33_03310, partial [Lachnospiraceae bacterium]|nr:hypothetical protein [Lachnospiraceae bacterium]
MDGDKTFKIFVFLQKVFYSFGVFVMFVTLTTFFIPPAEQYTGMLSLAPAGLSVVSLLQFFLTALCCTILRSLFETNLIFKKMSFL